MKTALLYAIFLLGIPNCLGLVVGFPLALLIGPLARLIRPQISIASPALSISVGLSMGIGCGVAAIIIVRLFGRMPGVAVPIVCSAWGLFYYYSRRQPKTEAWAYVAGIFSALALYWAWQPF